MKIIKLKKHKKIKKKKISKAKLSKKRAEAAKQKAKIARHRKRYAQKKTSKGFRVIFASFLEKKLAIENDFQGIPFSRKANSVYSTEKLLKAIILLIVMGIKRIYHANNYQDEGIIANLLGLEKLPSSSTIYRFLKGFGTLTFCRRVQRVNRDQIRPELIKEKMKICDGDTSTLRTHKNRKEGVCKGFNKKRPGSLCLQASQYFVNGMSVKPQILEGNMVPPKWFVTNNDLKEVRTLCGRIDWIRLDAGYMGAKMLSCLDNFSSHGHSVEKVKYIVNVGMGCIGAKNAKQSSYWRKWQKLSKGVMIQENKYSLVYKENTRLHRLIFVKKFFPGGKGKGEWKYYALCTNDFESSSIDLYYFYHQRQTIENFFDEAKNDYHLEHLPCTKMLSNSLYFNLLCLAFNILVLFRRQILRQQDQNIRLSTFQRIYLALEIDFDGFNLFIYRSLSIYYRRLLAILQRLKTFGVVLNYRIC